MRNEKFVGDIVEGDEGFQIEEVPIIFTDRREGQSKMSKGIFREAVFGVINLRWRGLTGKIKPRKSA